jgi:TldD protein
LSIPANKNNNRFHIYQPYVFFRGLKLKDIAEFAVNYAGSLGSSYAEARVRREISNTSIIKNGIPQYSGFLKELGIGIRLIINGGLGFASTNELSHDSITETILSAATMARASADTLRTPVLLSKMEVNRDSWEVGQRRKFGFVSTEDELRLLLEVDKSFKARKDVKFPSRILSLNKTITEQSFLNTEGTSISSKIPRIAFFYVTTAYNPSKGTAQRFNQIGESSGWEAVSSWRLTEFVSEEARILASILTKGKRPPKGNLDVILGSEVVGIVCHESCGHPFEADRILGREAAAAGESFVNVDTLGKRIGSPKVTVIDDPTIPRSYGYYLYDDEGVRASRRELIKDGIVSNFLHNRETAAKLGIKSNGAARSVSYSREPLIRMSNTYMERGDYSLQELTQEVSKGIYIKSFMEWNIDDRRFRQRYVGLEAYSISKGESTHLIRNPVLEMTTPALFRSVDAVGKDVSFSAATCGKGDPQQGAPVWTGGPDIRLRKIMLRGP